jgi:predicted nucleic acid-binding protein
MEWCQGDTALAEAQVFVIDASVAVKWYVSEELRDKALRLREDFLSEIVDLEAPSLILYEVGNAIRHHPGATEHECASAVRELRNLGITIHDLDDAAVGAAANLAFEEKLTFYDAAYLSLAKTIEATLITADKELYNQLSNERKALSQLLEQYK